MAKDPGSRKRTITLETVFHGLGAGQSRPPTLAYLFNRNGELVQSEPVSDRPVNFEAEADQSYKLMVGPDLLTESKVI
jgi:hypothetical protein